MPSIPPTPQRTIGRPPKPVAERFWSKIKIGQPDECWEWQTGLDDSGHGRFFVSETIGNTGAHRFAYELAHGPIPIGQVVCHKCDNARCCNARHFFLGTQLENVEDMLRKGRQAKGDRNGSRTKIESRPRGERQHDAKLTGTQVVEIRQLYASGNISYSDIAKLYGVCQRSIVKIVKRITWKHIP